MSWFYEHYKDASAIGIHTTALVHEERSEFQSIKVFDTVGHGRLLTLDDMVMLTELDEFVYHELITHVPMCVHESPKRVLIVGGGDGGCVREALRHETLETVVQCEIDERVTRVCQEHIPAVAGQLEDPRVELIFEDAVAYIERHPASFDVVVVDSTEPIGPAQALFGQPFLESVKASLRPGGVIAAQAESPFYAPDVLRDFFACMRRVFPDVAAYHGTVPTYPGGLWTFALASDGRRPEHLDLTRADAVGNKQVDGAAARAAFHLPPFVRALTGT